MLCKNCNKNEATKYSKYSSGEFCSKSCACTYSSMLKRDEINKKVSITIKKMWKENPEFRKKCLDSNIFINSNPQNSLDIEKRDACRKKLSESIKRYRREHPESIEHLRKINTGRIVSEETRRKLSEVAKENCKDINARHRLREIGRKGGFGEKGFTKNGTWYQSKLEKKCFEFLEENKIQFEPHKIILDTSKVSDIYLNHRGVWIELDGMDREKKKKYKCFKNDYIYWLAKIKIYKDRNLNYCIVKTFDEFKEFITKE